MKEVYTLEDLTSRELLDRGAEKPARLAVIGQPIAHSASPRMHQAALDGYGIDARYIRLEVAPLRVAQTFQRLRELGFIGCNVTVPHKLEAMMNCEVSPCARALGAVNTISFEGGMTRGYNTDGPGFRNAIEADFGIALSTLSVVILGAGGGAGQALAMQCAMAGVPNLVLVNRSLEKLGPVVERIRKLGGSSRVTALSFEDKDLGRNCLIADLIVNGSSVGLKEGEPAILPLSCLREGHLIYDTIYQPAVTPLLSDASALGCRTSNGITMLTQQGALAFQQWFPGTAPLALMQMALRN